MNAHRLLNAAMAVCAIAGAGYYAAAEYRLAGVGGFPLDDPWIHAQFARNIARGLGFSFNPGEPSAGSTAPLYTLVLVIPAVLGLDPLWSAKAIGAACTATLAIAAAGLARRVSGGSAIAAVTAGFGVALSSRLTWASVSGMEVPLYALLVTLALGSYLDWVETERRPWLWGVLAALSGATRPETFVLFPLLSLHAVIVRRHRPFSATAAHWAQAAVAFGAIAAAYVALNYHGSGTPLPTTFYAKTGTQGALNAVRLGTLHELWRSLTSGAFTALNSSFEWHFAHSPPLSLAAIAGAAALTGLLPGVTAPRGAAVLVIVFVAAPLAMGAMAPHPPLLIHVGRYVGHLTVLFFVIAGAGAAALHRLALGGWAALAIMATSLAWLAVQDVQFARHHAAMVRNMNDLDVAMSRWIADHTTPDAVVATNDIGALGYFAERYIVDMEGLVTPEILSFRRDGRFVEYLERAKPAVLVIFPDWYPSVVARTDLFTEVYRLTAPKVIAGEASLVVYRTPWSGNRLILDDRR